MKRFLWLGSLLSLTLLVSGCEEAKREGKELLQQQKYKALKGAKSAAEKEIDAATNPEKEKAAQDAKKRDKLKGADEGDE